ANSISTNVRLFSRLKSIFEREYDIVPTSTRHSPVSTNIDIMRIVAHLRTYNILGRGPCLGCDHVPIVRDLYCEGFEKLEGGCFQDFMEQISKQNNADDMEGTLACLSAEDEQTETYITSCFPGAEQTDVYNNPDMDMMLDDEDDRDDGKGSEDGEDSEGGEDGGGEDGENGEEDEEDEVYL
ncbi:hypothetical protein BCR41DRAFT_412736, partial [Lobosporangium transversale]